MQILSLFYPVFLLENSIQSCTKKAVKIYCDCTVRAVGIFVYLY